MGLPHSRARAVYTDGPNAGQLTPQFYSALSAMAAAVPVASPDSTTPDLPVSGTALDTSSSSLDSLSQEIAAAQASADAANAELAAIADDNRLSPPEKPAVIRDYSVITSEQSGVDAQAVQFLGVGSSQQVAYDNAISALTTYLNGLTAPTLWSDKTGYTNIFGPDFETNFNNVYTTRQTLLNAIYAAAKALADAAQGTANTAQTTGTNAQNTANTATSLAQQVNVINPGFDAGDTGWLKDPGWVIKTDSAGPGAGVGYAEYDATGSNAAIKNQALCFVTVGQTYKAQALIKAIGANGSAYVKIAWLDASLNIVGSNTPGSTVTGTTTAGSYVVAQAPAGATYGQVWIEVDSCTVGKYQVDNVVSTLQPSDLTEVPDGAGRYAAVQSPAAQATQAAQVAASYQPGQNIIQNPSFSTGCDQNNPIGWTLPSVSGVAVSCARNSNGMPTLLQMLLTTATPTTALALSAFTPCPASGNLSFQCKYAMVRATSAGDASCDIEFLNSSFGHISDSARLFTVSSTTDPAQLTYVLAQLQNIAIPAGTAYFRVRVYFEGAAETAGGVYLRVSDFKLEIGVSCTPFSDYATTYGNNLVVPGSGQQLGDQRNVPPIATANLRSKFSGQTISYSAAAGTPATATISVTASSLLNGASPIAYNAMSVGVSGTGGTTNTYYLYCDDPTYAGGARTLVASTNSNDVYGALGRIYVGSCSVTFPTSGSGSGGGTGGGGACVVAGSFAPFGPLTADSTHVDTPDGQVPIRKLTMSPQKCVRVVFENGTALPCSEDAPLMPGRVCAADALDHVLGTSAGPSRVCAVECIGIREVLAIDAGNVAFYASESPDGPFALHHNKIIP